MTTAETLARNLDAYGRKNSAAELRRLQASNEQLVQALEDLIELHKWKKPANWGEGLPQMQFARALIAQAKSGAK